MTSITKNASILKIVLDLLVFLKDLKHNYIMLKKIVIYVPYLMNRIAKNHSTTTVAYCLLAMANAFWPTAVLELTLSPNAIVGQEA